MLGIVFCGGKSSRMGRDKGLIPFKDKNWALLAAENLKNLNIPVLISINSSQLESYRLFFDVEMLLTDDESLGIGGPLLGLLSAYQLYRDEDFFILACDLPLMEENVLVRLLAAERAQPDHEAFVFVNAGVPEPLCGIYKSKGLRKIWSELHTNGLVSSSMKSVLSTLKVFELKISTQDQDCFHNFNTQDLT